MKKLLNNLKNYLHNLTITYKINIYKLRDILLIIGASIVLLYVATYALKTNQVPQQIEQGQQEELPDVEAEVNKEAKNEISIKETFHLEKVTPEATQIASEVIDNKINKESEVAESEQNDNFYLYDIPLKEETQRYIWKISKSFGISYELMLSVAKVESNFNPKIVTSEGSYGLYQIHKPSGTFDWLATVSETEFDNIHNFDWSKPKHNASAAVWYMSYLYDQWDGFSEEDRLALALLSYNRGLGSAKKYIKSHDPYDWHYVQKVLDYKIQLEKERYQ